MKNDSTEPIRFQITVKAWNQLPDGDMQLSDTKDIVFFPAMMELKPAEEKKVRIGSTYKAPVATERAYRIFVEELPAANVIEPEGATGRSAQVRLLTKMGVPIFIQPPTPTLKGQVSDLSVNKGKISFDVRNLGNSFFSVKNVIVTGSSKTGAQTFKQEKEGWYLLAGGIRHYELEISPAACDSTDRLDVRIETSLTDAKGEPLPLTDATNLGADACQPRAPK